MFRGRRAPDKGSECIQTESGETAVVSLSWQTYRGRSRQYTVVPITLSDQITPATIPLEDFYPLFEDHFVALLPFFRKTLLQEHWGRTYVQNALLSSFLALTLPLSHCTGGKEGLKRLDELLKRCAVDAELGITKASPSLRLAQVCLMCSLRAHRDNEQANSAELLRKVIGILHIELIKSLYNKDIKEEFVGTYWSFRVISACINTGDEKVHDIVIDAYRCIVELPCEHDSYELGFRKTTLKLGESPAEYISRCSQIPPGEREDEKVKDVPRLLIFVFEMIATLTRKDHRRTQQSEMIFPSMEGAPATTATFKQLETRIDELFYKQPARERFNERVMELYGAPAPYVLLHSAAMMCRAILFWKLLSLAPAWTHPLEAERFMHHTKRFFQNMNFYLDHCPWVQQPMIVSSCCKTLSTVLWWGVFHADLDIDGGHFKYLLTQTLDLGFMIVHQLQESCKVAKVLLHRLKVTVNVLMQCFGQEQPITKESVMEMLMASPELDEDWVEDEAPIPDAGRFVFEIELMRVRSTRNGDFSLLSPGRCFH